MGNYKYTFFDNQLVGVDHLNEITKRLVSGGISAVYSGVNFNVADINDINKTILTGGVVPESDTNLKVTATGSGKYLINPGLCFFNDGTTMEILSGGEEISVILGTKRYVYLVSDSNKMACFVEVTESEKQIGEFTLLAVINADGTITDKRTYARGKVPGFYASSENMEMNITETYTRVLGHETMGYDIEVTVGNGNFKHLCMTAPGTVFYCEFENGVAVNQVGSFAYTTNGKYYVNFGIDLRMADGKLYVPVTNFGIEFGKSVTVSYHLW